MQDTTIARLGKTKVGLAFLIDMHENNGLSDADYAEAVNNLLAAEKVA